ncbi:AbrB family transcriptional regulator [Kovacikia minuta CCNUW1]|uniref:AbrB family transcriptional regulator n=1 Tax=Kovacikia minuta TaxID=2931930 RepID=UPI001CCB0057|nr:AbrB family transcriptional regulator [Kovacikia minuta]UBF26875.1 AbrB family transcriptional regulator [Kovacikia minuta CCNUW1]
MTETTLLKPCGSAGLASPYFLVFLELVFAVLIGLGLISVGAAGGAWMLGGIAAGALVFYSYRSFPQQTVQPNRNSRKVGQILIGLMIGFSIQQNHLTDLSWQLPTFIAIALFLLMSGGVIGFLYSYLEKIDLLTATLATTPGNIGVMASIAADYEKNTALVSLVQLLRFTTIILVVPLIANVSYSHNVGDTIHLLIRDFSSFSPTYLLLLCIVLLAAFLSVYLGGKLRIPVASFFCPIIVGVLFAWVLMLAPFETDAHFNLPPLLKVLGQILLGTTIGEYWGINPHLGKATVFRATIPVFLMFLAGGVAASLAKLLIHADWLTCLLLTAPGGSPEMIWISLALNHNVEIVTAGHLVRLLTLNIALPGLVSLACYLESPIDSKAQ